MNDVLITAGLVISVGATIVLLVFALRQWKVQQEVRNIPNRYDEWLAEYKTKKFYIIAAQIVGVFVAIIGLSM
ncbi:MAG: hypothetical protein J6J93_09645 [Muribaculaceae bacterium]|nr:hypothetical protein [Muribaculaceae bacterium]